MKRWWIVLVYFLIGLFLASPVRAAVVINEFLPAPVSGNKEWVEFYNTDTATVDLSDYFFDDDANFQTDGGSSTKIPIAGLLGPTAVCYWELSTYLNNNGDTPTLFNTTGAIIDSYIYTQTTTDKSYARIPDGGEWQTDQMPTKTAINCLDLAPTPTPTATPTSTPTPTATPTTTPTASPTPSPKASGGAATVTPKPTASPQVLAAATATGSETLPDLTSNNEVKETEVVAEATPAGQKQPGWWLPVALIGGGGGMLSLALLPFLRKWYHEHSWLNRKSSTGGGQSLFGRE